MARDTDFTEELKTLHAGAEDSFCNIAVRKAIMEMCERGNLWKETQTVTFDDKNSAYLTTMSMGTDVSMAFTVKDADSGREVLPPEAWKLDREEFKLSLAPGYYADLSNRRFIVEMVVQPTIACSEFPDEFYTMYYSTVIVGASSYLKSVTNRPWTNLELGQYERRRFLQAIGTLRSRAKADNIHGKRSWRFRR